MQKKNHFESSNLWIYLFLSPRVWMKHPQENLGVVIKAHVGTDSQTELEVGKVGSEQVKRKFTIIYWLVFILPAIFRVHIFKLTSKKVAGEVVWRELQLTGFAPRNTIPRLPSAVCGLSRLILMSLTGTGFCFPDLMTPTFVLETVL